MTENIPTVIETQNTWTIQKDGKLLIECEGDRFLDVRLEILEQQEDCKQLLQLIMRFAEELHHLKIFLGNIVKRLEKLEEKQ